MCERGITPSALSLADTRVDGNSVELIWRMLAITAEWGMTTALGMPADNGANKLSTKNELPQWRTLKVAYWYHC